MALELKRRAKENLKNLRVFIEDTSDMSPEYFSIVEFPEFFGDGKSLIRLKGNRDRLQENTPIQVEVLDQAGKPMYYEFSTIKNSDDTIIISVWTYTGRGDRHDTAPGIGEVIIVGTARDVPDEFRDRPNVRWTRKVPIDIQQLAPSKIVFKSSVVPKGSVSASIQVVNNLPQSNGELREIDTSANVKYKKSVWGTTTSLEWQSGNTFNSEMISGSIYLDVGNSTLFPRLTGQAQPTTFTASIKDVDSTTILRLTSPFTSSDGRSDGSVHTYEYSDGDALTANIRYFTSASTVTTQNQISFANITLTNVNPETGRIASVNTLIKSEGAGGDFEFVGNTKVNQDTTFTYRVAIPTEHLNDVKTLKVQFLNQQGQVSKTETIIKNVVFPGGNVYIGGNQSIVTGSLFIANAIGSGLEMGGHSSGFLKSVGYEGVTSASLGIGPGGFIIYSGSNGLQMGADVLQGVGMQFVGDNDDRHLIFTTANGGLLDVKTDKFFIGTLSSQFVSGSDGNIEISSSLFHLDPVNNQLIIGADAIINADLSANNIRTPATIGGVQSTDLNASSSISSEGLARFVSASIGGWNVNTSSIFSSNLEINSSGKIKTRDYISDTKGWIIDETGIAEFANVKIRGTLATTTFEKESVNAVGGQLYVANSTTLSGSYSSSIATTYTAVTNSFTNTQDIFAFDTTFKLENYQPVTPLTQATMSDGTTVYVEYLGTLPLGVASLFDNGENIASADKIGETGGSAIFQINGGVAIEDLGGQQILPGEDFYVNYTSGSNTLTPHIFTDISPSSSAFVVENVTGFANGEILTLKKVTDTGFSTEYVKVHSTSRLDAASSNDFSGVLNVTRSYGSGTTGNTSSLGDIASVSQSYDVGQVVVSTGKIGSGFIRLNANPNDTSTPYMDIVERTGSGLYDIELKARLGDLSGLAGNDLVHGRSNPGFGLATDNVYLQGGIIATFGEIGGFSIDSTTISSSNNNLILRDSGQLTGSAILLGDKTTDNYVQYVDGTMTVRGDLAVDQLTTPATIGGSPSTLSNASASITSDGFAKFVSASIGGFEVSETQINSSNDLLILKSNGHITASAAMITGSNIQVYTPNFTIDESGSVSANRTILEDTARADSFTYTYTGITAGGGSPNMTSYVGTYSGSDGKVYSYLDLSGLESKLDNTKTGASFIRLSTAPTYPIGAIIHPFAYGETAGYTTGNTGMQVTIECAVGNIRFAFGATVGSGTGKQQFDYNGNLVYTDPKGSSTLFRSYINTVSGFYSREYDDSSVTIGPYTYTNKVWTVPSSTTISFSRGFFAWQVLYSSRNNNMTVGNVIPFTNNTYDLGNSTYYFDDIYATNGTIITSDRNLKSNISDSDLGLSFVNSLRPVSYKFNNIPAEIDSSGSILSYKTGSRTHYGLVAQELSSSLSSVGKTTLDFAGITTGSSMGLRYTELISPVIKAIQELSDEVNQLKLQLSQSQG